MTDGQPALISGVYTQPYNEIVRPERVWKITKYFLRRWTPYLSASEVWLVIGARQLSYFNERRPWFRAYDRTLAEAAGLHVKVFRRTIKKAICDGEGNISAFLQKTKDPHYRRVDGVTRQSQTQYNIRLDDPLTPGDANALAYWLRRHCPPQISPKSVRALLQEAAGRPQSDLRASSVAPVPAEAPDLLAVKDVVAHVYPMVGNDKAWREAADALHTHLVAPELAHFETQYFRRRWVPLLGPGPALLLSYLRSLCYLNEDSGEVRDEVALESGRLEDVFQISSRTLRRWFAKLDEFTAEEQGGAHFVNVLSAVKQSNQKVLTTYRINLRTPLTAEDLVDYRQTLLANGHALTGVADEKFPTGQTGRGQIVPHIDVGGGHKAVHTTKGTGQKVPDTSEGNGQKVPHGNGGGGQNVPGWETEEGSYKYYKILAETIGLNTVQDLRQKVPEQEQHVWCWENGQARSSFAAVVAGHSLHVLLDRIGVQEPARGEILSRRPSLEEAVAWVLYALQQDGLERPVSYVISRLCGNDPPPLDYLQMASLSWEQWRVYAWAWHAQSLSQTAFERFSSLPLFTQWGEIYATLPLDDLPFEVGRGLTALDDQSPRAGPQPHDDGSVDLDATHVAQWRAVLEELSLQMTRATFDAWLRDARLAAVEGDAYVVAVSRPEAGAWLQNRLQDTIERTVRAVTGGQVRTVRFVVNGS